MADVNIFQGALFHEDAVEDIHGLEPIESGQVDTQRSNRESHYKISKSKTRPSNLTQKPAAHRVVELPFACLFACLSHTYTYTLFL